MPAKARERSSKKLKCTLVPRFWGVAAEADGGLYDPQFTVFSMQLQMENNPQSRFACQPPEKGGTGVQFLYLEKRFT